VRIALEHLQRLVHRDAGHLDRIDSLVEQATGCLVTQVVEVKVVDLCPLAGSGERPLDGFSRQSWEDAPVVNICLAAFTSSDQGFHCR
jgi:hypothetical protein